MPISLEDRLAILEVVARYNFAFDHMRPEEWADLFTDDGVFTVGDDRRAAGRAELVEYVRNAKAAGRLVSHWTSNVIVEGDGTMAEVRLYATVYDLAAGIRSIATGEFEDQMVKQNGRWKFRRRHFIQRGAG